MVQYPQVVSKLEIGVKISPILPSVPVETAFLFFLPLISPHPQKGCERAMLRKLTALFLILSLVFSLSATASADGTGTTEGYLILGADLSQEQKATVYDLLNIQDDSRYAISYTTNQEEHEALDGYLSASVIGSKALSSILLIPGEAGSGLSIEAYNITYCTIAMYQNALLDAGVQDCDIHIAAPSGVSGTCALVSAMKAYSTMTGESISTHAADTAVNELVTTGEVGDQIGDNDKAAQLIAALKQKMLEDNLNQEDIATALDQICTNMNINISADLKQDIVNLMLKVKDTNIDVDALKQQAGDLYSQIQDTVAGLNIDTEAATGFLQKLLQAILDFVRSLIQ